MYKVHFKNSNGRYYYGLQVADIGKVLRLTLEFKDKIPYILVTNNDDHSVLESENGKIVFPSDIDFSNIPPMGLSETIPKEVDGVVDLIKKRNKLEIGTEAFVNAEAVLLVAAIQHNIDWQRHGWSRP